MQVLIIMYCAFIWHIFYVTSQQKSVLQPNTIICLLLLMLYISSVKLLLESGWVRELSFCHLSTGFATSLFYPLSYLFVQKLYSRPVLYPITLVHLVPLIIYIAGWVVYFQRPELHPYSSRFFFNVFDYGIAILYSVQLLKEFHAGAGLKVLHHQDNIGTSEDTLAKNIRFVGVGEFDQQVKVKTGENTHKVDAPEFTREQIEVMKTTLEGAMVYSEPYLKQKFSLPDLAELTNISVHQLSAFINWFYDMNYSDFINMYRIEYCKRKIIVEEEWRYLTLQAIAEESGFGNRNTFTAAFKKFTNSTPMEFLKQCKLTKSQAV